MLIYFILLYFYTFILLYFYTFICYLLREVTRPRLGVFLMGKTLENFMKIYFIAAAAALMIALNPALADDSITEAEVIAAQKGWCAALVEISATNAKSGQAAAKALAESVIDSVSR
jgi:hypothetical protein